VAKSDKLRLTCPGCGAELVVDTTTGSILSHRQPSQPAAPEKDFDALFADLDSQKARAEELFEREKAAFEDRDRLLEEKFKEAVKRAEDEPDLPRKRPFDFD
jgi:hypothetical protein